MKHYMLYRLQLSQTTNYCKIIMWIWQQVHVVVCFLDHLWLRISIVFSALRVATEVSTTESGSLIRSLWVWHSDCWPYQTHLQFVCPLNFNRTFTKECSFNLVTLSIRQAFTILINSTSLTSWLKRFGANWFLPTQMCICGAST